MGAMSQLRVDFILLLLLVLLVHNVIFLVFGLPVPPRGGMIRGGRYNVSGAGAGTVLVGGGGSVKAGLTEVMFGGERLMCTGGLGSRPKDLLILMFGNTAFLGLTQNWLCNTALFDGVHERTLMVVDTEEALESLRGHDRVLLCVDKGLNNARGYSYGMLGYWVIAQRRVRLFSEMIRVGFPVLLVESDALWVSNPLGEVRGMSNGSDLVLYDDGNDFGMGLVMVRWGDAVGRLFEEVRRRYDRAVEAAGRGVGDLTRVVSLDSEQVILTRLVKARVFGQGHAVFPRCKFASGKWYNGGVVGERGVCVGVLPLMIQNNWIVGIESKVNRAKRWGHWFVRNESTGSCGSEAGLRRLLDRMVESVRNGVPG